MADAVAANQKDYQNESDSTSLSSSLSAAHQKEDLENESDSPLSPFLPDYPIAFPLVVSNSDVVKFLSLETISDVLIGSSVLLLTEHAPIYSLAV